MMGFQGRFRMGLLALCAVFVFSSTSLAALEAVSGLQDDGVPPQLTAVPADGAPTQVAVSLANGFPIWYQDEDGLKLELCLERAVTLVGGATATPCLLEGGGAFPFSFPNNFLSESFYWLAIAENVFQSSIPGLLGQGDMLLVLGQEATFDNLGQTPTDGQQSVFSRIRVRINVPINGTYRVTHPFGSYEYVITNAPQTNREINQTQDIGGLALDFLASLNDGPEPVEPPVNPSVNEGIVNEDGASIGPFLEADPPARVFDTNGNLYLTNPGTELIPLRVPITPGLNDVDYFELELISAPPEGFFLNAAAESQSVRLNTFQVVGKVFNDGRNLVPVAVDDFAATSIGQPVLIDVLLNDVDVREVDLMDPFNPDNPLNTNVHGINPQAVALVDPISGGLVLVDGPGGQQGVPTAEGGRARRVTDLPTGRARILYTPPAGFAAVDSFEYVVQDTGGLISEPALVTVTVEDLAVDRADYRVRLGKWDISGSSSDLIDNEITLFAGPRARLSGAQHVPPVATNALGSVHFHLKNNAIDYDLRISPLPLTEITEVFVRVGEPGENGPIIFFLYDFLFDDPFDGTLKATLVPSQLLSRPAQGVVSFADALAAITSGRTYVSVHTNSNPAGEMRGQIEQPLIGTALVDSLGEWSFSGKSAVSPGPLPTVSAESSNGIRVLSVPLRLR